MTALDLRHYATDVVTLDRSRVYYQLEANYAHEKPRGFWVSIKGDDDWAEWNRAEEFIDIDAQVEHEVTLAPRANILELGSMQDLVDFMDDYSVATEMSTRYRDREYRAIDWRHLATQVDGIIIAPYQWPARYSMSWYYGWDCASGCIWNLDAIEGVEPIRQEVGS